MELKTTRVKRLAERIESEGITNRHRTETRQQFETVYDISQDPTDDEIETTFRLAIQARSQPLDRTQYETLLDNVDPVGVLNRPDRQAAFDELVDQKHIGQKVANEFLRIAVDVLGVNQDWRDDLHVALDTNVIQTLVKTGAISLDESERDRGPGRIVNMDPESSPTKLIGYGEIQSAFEEAADEIDEPRIVFDELWTEHRSFISDPLLRHQSVFADMLDDDLVS